MQMQPAEFINRMVHWVVMTINIFLGLRFTLRLFNADTANDFVSWLYGNTYPLLKPFVGIFESFRLEGGYTVEFSTLFAIIVYSLLGFLILALVDVLDVKPAKSRK